MRSTTSRSPLDIPEILHLVGRYLPLPDLQATVCVSRSFHEILIPSIRTNLEIYPDSRWAGKGTPTFEAVQRHAHLVHQLTIRYNSSLEFCGRDPITYTHLKSLDFWQLLGPSERMPPREAPPMHVAYIQRHQGTLKSVSLDCLGSEAIVSALLECPRLHQLTMVHPSIEDLDSCPEPWISQYERLWPRMRTINLTDIGIRGGLHREVGSDE